MLLSWCYAAACRPPVVADEMHKNTYLKFWLLVNSELARLVSLNAMFTSSFLNIIVQRYPSHYYSTKKERKILCRL